MLMNVTGEKHTGENKNISKPICNSKNSSAKADRDFSHSHMDQKHSQTNNSSNVVLHGRSLSMYDDIVSDLSPLELDQRNPAEDYLDASSTAIFSENDESQPKVNQTNFRANDLSNGNLLEKSHSMYNDIVSETVNPKLNQKKRTEVADYIDALSQPSLVQRRSTIKDDRLLSNVNQRKPQRHNGYENDLIPPNVNNETSSSNNGYVQPNSIQKNFSASINFLNRSQQPVNQQENSSFSSVYLEIDDDEETNSTKVCKDTSLQMTTKMKIRVIGIVSILSVVTAGIAIGLSCSVLAGLKASSSMEEIFHELQNVTLGKTELEEELQSLHYQLEVIQNNISVIDDFRQELDSLHDSAHEASGSTGNNAEMTLPMSSTNAPNRNENGEMEDGWITPFNGFQYKNTLATGSWGESRQICQSWGGDLIVHGIRESSIRNEIHRKLSLNDEWWFWIGLGDQESEGNFVWVNGEKVSMTDEDLWRPGQPDGGIQENCCATPFSLTQPHVNDLECSYSQFAICEKPIQN